MDYAYYDVLTRARSWAAEAVDQGLIAESVIDDLCAEDEQSVDPLFKSNHESPRPMIVAFMGGTGVGKSSLINRLAGKSIAKSGIERPTSREVTLYHHRSLQLGQLPPDLPLDKIKISQHDDDQHRIIVFIDMPDFDSIESANKALVLQWLPHVDVLLYVVSPERYRDRKSWQLLLAEGGRHAWLFVMNQWDRALPDQFDDFKKQLNKAGFSDPIVLRTSCVQTDGDDFAELLEHLRGLSSGQTLTEMTRRHEQTRLKALNERLRPCRDQLSSQDVPALLTHLDEQWFRLTTDLQQGLTWTLKQTAQGLASASVDASDVKVWDDWAQICIDDLLDDLCFQADRYGIPHVGLKNGFETIKSGTGKRVIRQAGLAARQAMLKPGNNLQRWALRVSSVAEVILPLSAMAVVGYQVFAGFYHSAIESTAYLGVDFAVHAGLLIMLSWLLPFFLRKKLAPSMERAAYRGLVAGVNRALADVRHDIEHQLNQRQLMRDHCLQDLLVVMNQCEAVPDLKPLRESSLARVMPEVISQTPRDG